MAVPLAFGFSATISEVQGDVAALDLPFALTVGQQFEGAYSFLSEEDLLDVFLHRELGKQGQIALTIEDTDIQAHESWTTQ
jgi:hypothetical protein